MVISSLYNYETQKLLVEFSTEAVYEYQGVTIDDYKLFSESESTGKGFNENIRKYEGTKLERNAEIN
jgi:hypothetical protein